MANEGLPGVQTQRKLHYPQPYEHRNVSRTHTLTSTNRTKALKEREEEEEEDEAKAVMYQEVTLKEPWLVEFSAKESPMHGD